MLSIASLRVMMVSTAIASLAGCHVSPGRGSSDWTGSEKVKFSLENIHSDGLRGPTNGLLAVSYEFCVPANNKVYQEVQQIDPSLQIHPGSRGRSGCSTSQSLAIGDTHQAHWHSVLQELSSLTYVDEIRECFFE